MDTKLKQEVFEAALRRLLLDRGWTAPMWRYHPLKPTLARAEVTEDAVILGNVLRHRIPYRWSRMPDGTILISDP